MFNKLASYLFILISLVPLGVRSQNTLPEATLDIIQTPRKSFFSEFVDNRFQKAKVQFSALIDPKTSPCYKSTATTNENSTINDDVKCRELIEICRNSNYNLPESNSNKNPYGYLKGHCEPEYTHINEQHVKALVDASSPVNEYIGCCSNGVCTLGNKPSTCNLVDDSILGLSDNSKNKDIFSILSSISRGSQPDKSVAKLDSHSCEKCWKAAHTSINIEKYSKSYEDDLESLSRKIRGSSSLKRNLIKENTQLVSEYYTGFAQNYINKTINDYRKNERVKTSENIATKEDTAGGIIKAIASLENIGLNILDTGKSILMKNELAKLEVVCVDNIKIEEILSCAKTSGKVTKDRIKSELEGLNFNVKDILLMNYQYISRNYTPENNEIPQQPIAIKKIRDLSENIIRHERVDGKYQQIIESCNNFDSKKETYDLVDSIRFLVGGSFSSVMSSSTQSLEDLIDNLTTEIKLNPKYSFLMYDHTLYCNAFRNKSLEQIDRLFDLNEEPSTEEIISTKNNICPTLSDLKDAYCTEELNSLTNEEYNNLSEGEKIVANSFMCKNELSIVSNDSSELDDLSRHLKNTMAENPSYIQARAKEANSGGIGRRNNALSGSEILENLVGRSSGSVSSSDDVLRPLSGNSKSLPSNSSDQPISPNTQSTQEPSFQESLMGQINEMKNNVTGVGRSSNNNAFISDQSIQQAIASNPKIEDKINEVKDLIQDSKENGDLSGVDNPNQAIFDYLKDEKSIEAQELANSENSELRAQLAELKNQINDEKKIAEKKIVADASNSELQAANARIKKLEGIVDQMRNSSQGIISNSGFGNNSDDNVEFIPVGVNNGSQKSNLGSSNGRDIASVQTPIVNLIPKTINENLESIISKDEGLILLKDEALYITIDETQYPLNVQEVVLTSGVVSGIKVQKGALGSVILPISSFKGDSKKAVEQYIAKEGSKLLKTEKKVQEVAKSNAEKTSTAYLDFLCSIHPEKEECK